MRLATLKYYHEMAEWQTGGKSMHRMQEEMAAVQPKLSEASKEVDSSMVLVEKEQSEVADLEKVICIHQIFSHFEKNCQLEIHVAVGQKRGRSSERQEEVGRVNQKRLRRRVGGGQCRWAAF